jgi:hypothetical protein
LTCKYCSNINKCNIQAVVFVIDSSDQQRLLESSNELSKLMTEKELKDAALLILANKQV